jgi:hypothetical protein
MNARILGSSVLMALSLVARGGAQQGPDPTFTFQVGPPPGLPGIGVGIGGPPMGVTFDMLSVEPFEWGPPVQDAPYSGEAVTEVTQTLADGNRIERRQVTIVARDSRGRQRREEQLTAIGPVLATDGVRFVTITDPVAGTHFALDPVRMVAMRSRTPFAGGGRAGVFVGATRAGVMTRRSGAVSVLGAPGIETRERGAVPPEPRVEQLGAKDIDGIRAEGTRTTITLPAGAIGNARPLDVVSERWYSPELHVVVLSTRTDPRFGETIYRLTNVVRAEPPSDLFQVPSDYQIQDMKPMPDVFFERP